MSDRGVGRARQGCSQGQAGMGNATGKERKHEVWDSKGRGQGVQEGSGAGHRQGVSAGSGRGVGGGEARPQAEVMGRKLA